MGHRPCARKVKVLVSLRLSTHVLIAIMPVKALQSTIQDLQCKQEPRHRLTPCDAMQVLPEEAAEGEEGKRPDPVSQRGAPL